MKFLATYVEGQMRTSAAHRMKRLAACVSMLVLLVCLSCGPPKPVAEQASSCRPYSVFTESKSGGLKIGWEFDCSRLISGYEILIAPTSVDNFEDISTFSASVKPHNDVVYPGDTDPEDPIVYYDAGGLENGVLYRVAVRVIFPDRTMSQLSKPVLAMCGPRGEFELVTRYSRGNDGYSFALSEYVPVDDLNNDIYFYSKDGAHYLSSPSRLDGFLRTNFLMHQPTSWNFEDYILRGNTHGEKPTDDRVKIHLGDMIWLMTSDGHQAQIRVLSIKVTDGKGTVRLEFAYWPSLKTPTP